jgi:hypothetical protein
MSTGLFCKYCLLRARRYLLQQWALFSWAYRKPGYRDALLLERLHRPDFQGARMLLGML